MSENAGRKQNTVKHNNATVQEGKELLKKIQKDRANALNNSILMMNFFQVIQTLIPGALSTLKYRTNFTNEQLAVQVGCDIANIKKDIDFTFSLVVRITRRIVFREYADELNLKESVYYIYTLLKKASEIYNIEIRRHNAYKFARLIARENPKLVSLSSTKILNAIDFHMNRVDRSIDVNKM